MKTRTRFDRSRIQQRGAFTLIELLVVIAIIAALAALSAGAVLKFIEVQQNNNTQSTLDRTQGELGKAWSKVKNQAYKETIPPTIVTWIQSNLTWPASSDPNAMGRTRVIYVKLKLRQAFPMSFNEALNPSPLPPLAGYVTYLGSLGITGSTAASAPYESSACLLMALQRGVSGAGINPEQLTQGGATGNYNGIPYLTDAWNRPIFFARFPTGCPVLNPSGALSGANDPGDPQGYLQTASWGTTYGPAFAALLLQDLAPANSSFKLAPMVASGGAFNWDKAGTLPVNTTTLAPISSSVMYSSNP
ncbi:MAG TPA: prepilin-type N-terminal cleavage/methylation domain-containing protein [Gemmataceae bacterium]|nr:prepilin-type N-terminal cleavage/methylation domain-containing protein [Gemmataceae bacterium]